MKSAFNALMLFCLCSVSCIGVTDSLEPFCYIKNNSKRNITVRFSNSEKLNLNIVYERWNTYVASNTVYLVNKQGDKLFEEYYKGNNKRLYIFYLDQDTALMYYNRKDTINLVNKSFLKRDIVDVRKLKANDTLYYYEHK